MEIDVDEANWRWKGLKRTKEKRRPRERVKSKASSSCARIEISEKRNDRSMKWQKGPRSLPCYCWLTARTKLVHIPLTRGLVHQ
jgi:hypothetical protein